MPARALARSAGRSNGEAVTLQVLKYLPLYPVGSPEFDATAAGWVRYAQTICRLLRSLGIEDFDLEIWNELTFGSNFLDINKYYEPDLVFGVPDLDQANRFRPGGRAWEMSKRMTDALEPEFPNVRIVWGFSNTQYTTTKIEDPPSGIDGQSCHPYGYSFVSLPAGEFDTHGGGGHRGRRGIAAGARSAGLFARKGRRAPQARGEACHREIWRRDRVHDLAAIRGGGLRAEARRRASRDDWRLVF